MTAAVQAPATSAAIDKPGAVALRIGIDAHIVGAGKGGVERFLREVCLRVEALAPQHRFVVFVNQAAMDGSVLPIASDRVELVPLPFANPLIERALVLPWLARRHRLDVLLVQRLAPWAMGGCRIAVTIHDITPIKFPDQYRGLTNALVRRWTASSARRSHVVLTPTDVVAREIAQLSGDAPAKFHAYYNGVDPAMFKPLGAASERDAIARRFGCAGRFVFASGALERRKNVETMMRAMRHVPPSACAELIVVGGTRDAGYAAELQQLASEPGIAGRVRLLGFVSEADLGDLYRGCSAFVSASRDEGFNMPVLEAMASGAPALCSDIAVHRELFDGAAAFFADDARALADQLLKVLGDPALAQRLVEAGAARARQFTWEAAARRVVAALEHACARGHVADVAPLAG